MPAGSPTPARLGARSLGLILAVAAVALGGGLPFAAARPAGAATVCVGVIVDATRTGGAVRTGCAKGDPATGYAALRMAGFSYTQRPDGLVCQINRVPSCGATTTTTYWSYWYRQPGSSSWVYSNLGAGGHNPKPSSTEAWVWQNGGKAKPPSISLAKICPTATPTPTPVPRATHSPTPTAHPTRRTTRSRPRPVTPPASSVDRRPAHSSTLARAASTQETGRPPATHRAGPATRGPTAPAARAAAATDRAAPRPSAGRVAGAQALGVPPSSPRTTPLADRPAGREDGAGGVLGLALGGALVALLTAAAILRSRRAR